MIGAVGDFGPHILQSLVVLTTVLLTFGYSKAKNALCDYEQSSCRRAVTYGVYLAAHCAAMSAFVFLSSLLFGGTAHAENLIVLAWLTAGICGIATGVLFFIPPRILRDLATTPVQHGCTPSGPLSSTPVFVIASKRLWKPTTALTFELVRFLMGPFVKMVITYPSHQNDRHSKLHGSK